MKGNECGIHEDSSNLDFWVCENEDVHSEGAKGGGVVLYFTAEQVSEYRNEMRHHVSFSTEEVFHNRIGCFGCLHVYVHISRRFGGARMIFRSMRTMLR